MRPSSWMLRGLRIFFKIVWSAFAVLGVVVVAGLFVAATMLASKWDKEPHLEERNFLYISFPTGLARGSEEGLFFSGSGHMHLKSVVDTLAQATNDDRIAGIALFPMDAQLSLSEVEEIGRALQKFRDSGKPVYAFAESFGESAHGLLSYTLASSADQIWLQHSGLADISGYSMTLPFFREAMEEWDVHPQFFARGEEKGAFSSFTHERLPAAQRRNLQKLMDSFLAQSVSRIAEGRGMSLAQVGKLVDTGLFSADSSMNAGLVDRIGYRGDFMEALRELLGEDVQEVPLADYAMAALIEPEDETDANIARINLVGEIVLASSSRRAPFTGAHLDTSSREVIDALENAAMDLEIDAIVLHIDSPGGSYAASDAVRQAVVQARSSGKPIVASMGRVAASGGYLIALAADRIVANEATITGSIGVAGGKIYWGDFWDNLGVWWENVHAGANATQNSPFTRFSPRTIVWLTESLDRVYGDFVRHVSESRSLSEDDVESVARGQIWSGKDAREYGLVDVLGGWREVELELQSLLDLSSDARFSYRTFPQEDDWLLQLQDALFSFPAIGLSLISLISRS